MIDAEIKRRDAEARVLLHGACEIYRRQLRGGGLHARLGTARAWADAEVAALLEDPAVGSTVGHQCMYGQRVSVAGGRLAAS